MLEVKAERSSDERSGDAGKIGYYLFRGKVVPLGNSGDEAGISKIGNDVFFGW
ncbi:MAG: hypothetical protein JRI96_17150 [Deltaproteobacteria bacterium]|nr:hypothetical protein [Deltaproteobacteria bacterium]